MSSVEEWKKDLSYLYSEEIVRHRCQTFRFIGTTGAAVKLHEGLAFFAWPLKTIFRDRGTIVHTFFPTNQGTTQSATFDEKVSRCFRNTGTREDIEKLRPWATLEKANTSLVTRRGRLENSRLLDWMLELEIDKVDRAADQPQYSPDLAHDRRCVRSYPDWSLALQNRSLASHHHSLGMLKRNQSVWWTPHRLLTGSPGERQTYPNEDAMSWLLVCRRFSADGTKRVPQLEFLFE